MLRVVRMPSNVILPSRRHFVIIEMGDQVGNGTHDQVGDEPRDQVGNELHYQVGDERHDQVGEESYD